MNECPSPAHLPAKRRHPERYCWVGAPEIFSLSQACAVVNQALDETCYLVGSATEHRNFRDIDVRVIMDDTKWEALFGKLDNGEMLCFWSLFNTAISEYLQKRTGLKVDFQIQKRSTVKKSDWEKSRHPLGIFIGDSDRAPLWMKANSPQWRKSSL